MLNNFLMSNIYFFLIKNIHLLHIFTSLQKYQNTKINYENIKNNKQQRQMEKKKIDQYIEICHQFLVIGPYDLNICKDLQQKLKQLTGSEYSKQIVIDWITKNLISLQYDNTRLLSKIQTDYFWTHAAKLMVQCMQRDTWLLSSRINTLSSSSNGIVELTKYQIYLILCHMFCGTFPHQLSEQEVSFGALMVVNDDEDEITSAEKLKLRTNKLKSVVYYFCVMCFRHHKGKLVQSMEEVVVFQRQKGKETYQSIYESTVFLRPAEVKFGKYFENEKNKVSINPCLENILGIRTNEDTIQFQERLIFSHPEIFVVKILQIDPLSQNEVLLVTGAQQYCKMSSISRKSGFNFHERFEDKSEMNPLLKTKQTAFMFYQKPFWSSCFQPPVYTKQMVSKEIIEICTGLQGLQTHQRRKKGIVSGKLKNQNSKNQIEWDLAFITSWMAMSICEWDDLTFYVDESDQAANLTILAKELAFHTIKEMLEIIHCYVTFRKKNKINLRFLEYVKHFVL